MPNLLWFEWEKCPDGYFLDELKREHVEFISQNTKRHTAYKTEPTKQAPSWLADMYDYVGFPYPEIKFGLYIVPKSNRVLRFNPLEEAPAAFMEYGEVTNSVGSALSFVSKYGRPEIIHNGLYDLPPTALPLNEVQHIATPMAKAIETWNRAKKNENYREFDNLRFLEDYNNPDHSSFNPRFAHFYGEVSIRLRPNGGRSPFFAISPNNLTAAMWVQFAQAVSSNTQLRRCAICPNWFSYGTGTGRRTTADYCSARCRKAAYQERIKVQQLI